MILPSRLTIARASRARVSMRCWGACGWKQRPQDAQRRKRRIENREKSQTPSPSYVPSVAYHCCGARRCYAPVRSLLFRECCTHTGTTGQERSGCKRRTRCRCLMGSAFGYLADLGDDDVAPLFLLAGATPPCAFYMHIACSAEDASSKS